MSRSRGPLAEGGMALEKFAAGMAGAFGPRLRLLRLFGSAARGEFGPDSDLDVVVVVEALRDKDTRLATRLASEVGIEHGVLISAMLMSPEHLDLLRWTEQRLARDIDEGRAAAVTKENRERNIAVELAEAEWCLRALRFSWARACLRAPSEGRTHREQICERPFAIPRDGSCIELNRRAREGRAPSLPATVCVHDLCASPRISSWRGALDKAVHLAPAWLASGPNPR